MDPIQVAILGQGRSGRDIHGAYLAKDRRYRIAAVADPLADRRARAQSEYGCDVVADPEELLGRKDLDLIVNASPSKFHVPYTARFLEAGLHVLCEKPLASRAADVDRLIALSKASGKLLAIYQQSRYSPSFMKVREVIASGKLGDPVQINIAYSGFQRRYDWQTLQSEMGGCLLNTGPHPLDQALQFFGADRTPKVSCFMRNATSYGTAEDHVQLTLSDAGPQPAGPLVHVEVSSCTRYPLPTYQVFATRGGLSGDTRHLEWQYYNTDTARPLELTLEPIKKPDGTPAYCSDGLEWIKEEWSLPEGTGLFETMGGSFYSMLHRALTEGAPLEITPQQVRQQIAVIEECQQQNPHIYAPTAG